MTDTTTSESPRPVYTPPRPAQSEPGVMPTEKIPATIPPGKNAVILHHLEQGIQSTFKAMIELGFEKLDSIEKILTHLECRYLTNYNRDNTDNTDNTDDA